MAVTKRTRFEIFRRDGFRCFYCGTRGNETTGSGLTIDHVIPEALGGTDDPENLVSACADCNAGKTSTSVDAALLAEVDRATAAHKAARALAMRAVEADLDAAVEHEGEVWALWTEAAPPYASEYEPMGWGPVVANWYRDGVPLAAIRQAFDIAWSNGAVAKGGKFPYAVGIVRNTMAGAEDRAKSLAAGDNVIWHDGYAAGVNDTEIWRDVRELSHDLVAAHIDGRHEDGMYGVLSSAEFLPWKRPASGT